MRITEEQSRIIKETIDREFESDARIAKNEGIPPVTSHQALIQRKID
jgi:hypothetical protein